MKILYRSKSYQACFIIAATFGFIFYNMTRENPVAMTRRIAISNYKELEERIKEDKGSGCEIPVLDPFAEEMMQYDEELPKVVCRGIDWVRCHFNECSIEKNILEKISNIRCTYRDILFKTDFVTEFGPPITVVGETAYALTKSDHVQVMCTGSRKNSFINQIWMGVAAGFRSQIDLKPVPSGREDSIDVLMFLFDSTSKNGFIRRMSNSFKLLKELGAIILDGYNIVGDGTPAALFPLLTGKTELEMPDVRKAFTKSDTFNISDFIFAKVKEYGYRTAYFEDSPGIGTFQRRFRGFGDQPADHYLRHFFKIDEKISTNYYCVGDTPRYDLMMDLTKQFLKQSGKHFCLTFIGDITHNNFNMISTADNSTVMFLKDLKNDGILDKTLVFVMGDHGSRYARNRNSYQGKLEERLPLMAILLPKALTDSRPDVQAKLESNVKTLTTPHDIYATYLDALDLKHLQSSYRVKGADLYRGLSLLESIPSNRSCSEAGIDPHWCTCLRWNNVSPSEEIYLKAATAFVDYINELTEPMRHKCALRNLIWVDYVMIQRVHEKLLRFVRQKDRDAYLARYGTEARGSEESYQVKVTVGPGVGIYEASGVYLVKENKFVYNIRDISRVNAYNNEPSCISSTHPHLNMFCYCVH